MPQQVDGLVQHLFEGVRDEALRDEVAAWLVGSARFRAFAEAHRDKIRKKLRGAADAGARRDVRAELRCARLLSADRRIGLTFEAYGSGRGGPDFTVAFAGERAFNLEVTRPRRPVEGPGGVAGTLLAKLRQLPPSVPNGLVVAVEGGSAEAVDVDAAARPLRARADAKDEQYFAGRGFQGTRGFYEQYLRLGAVIVVSEAAVGEARAALWTNRSARIALPERAGRACLQCLRGDPADP